MGDRDDIPAAALRLAAIVESSDDAIVGKDLNGTIQSWNRGAERIFGYTAEEAIGRNITFLIPETRLSEETEVLERIRSDQSVDHFETVRRRKDGTMVPVSLTVSPIRAADGSIVGMSKIARDITERKHAEALVSDLQRRLLALVAASGSLLGSPRLDDVLPATVNLARELLSADAYAVWRQDTKTPIWKIVSSTGISDTFAREAIDATQVLDLATSPDPFVVDDVHTFKPFDGRRQAYEREGIESMLAIPLPVGGVPFGWLVAYYRSRHQFTDVEVQTGRALGNLAAAAVTTAALYDDQRRSREIVERANHEASVAGRAKDEFLATLSHELRTPLNAVLGWARMLREGSLRPERRSHAIDVIQRNAEAQLRLVEDLLDVSGIITGKFRLSAQRVDLSEIIDAALESLQPAATARTIQVETALDSSVGPVWGDPGRLQQAVWNLLANAVKFTPRDGRVRITLSRVEAQARLEVSDSGQGMALEALPFIFDRFRQIDSGPGRAHTGLGLGLAIVRHIVELHGGEVSATSGGEGRGSTFTMTLPLMSERATRAGGALPTVGHNERDAVLVPILEGLNVLLVEDDPDSRELIAGLLTDRAAQVTAVESAEAALRALDEHLPDLILSDIEMPTMDGYDFIRTVRRRGFERGGGIAAIAVTAYARPEDRARALTSGFQVHLAKPVDFNELISAVASLGGKTIGF